MDRDKRDEKVLTFFVHNTYGITIPNVCVSRSANEVVFGCIRLTIVKLKISIEITSR